MDALHPGTRFILTVRDEQKWYDSYRNHFEDKESTPMEVLLYGPQARFFEGYDFLPPKTRALLKEGWRRLGRLSARR